MLIRNKTDFEIPAPALDLSTRVAVSVMLVVWTSLLVPLNASSNALARAFTTDKVAAYFAFAVLGIHLLRHGITVLRKVPGFGIICLLLVSMAWSTYRADDRDLAIIFFLKEVTYAGFYLAWMIVSRTREANRLVWRWMMYVTVVLAVLAIFEPATLHDVLPNTDRAATAEKLITMSNPFEPGIPSSRDMRRSVLWFAADNLAYAMMPGVLYLIHLLIAERPRKWVVAARIMLLGVLAFALVGTASRGGTLSMLLGAIVIVMLSALRRGNRIRTALIASAAVAVCVVASSYGGVQALTERYRKAFGLFVESEAVLVGGMETGRVLTAQIAYDEFLSRPWFGWGGADFMGGLPNSSNHLGHLNVLGQYGIVGFGLNLLLLVVMIRRIRSGILIWKRQGSNEGFMGYFLIGLVVGELVSGFFRTVPIMMLVAWGGGFYLAARLKQGQPQLVRRQIAPLARPTHAVATPVARVTPDRLVFDRPAR